MLIGRWPGLFPLLLSRVPNVPVHRGARGPLIQERAVDPGTPSSAPTFHPLLGTSPRTASVALPGKPVPLVLRLLPPPLRRPGGD